MTIESFDDDSYAPENHYPPIGTEESAMVLVISSDNFTVLSHTGRFMHGQCNCAGFDGEEIGLKNVPDEPGYWVLRNGTMDCGEDWADLYGDWSEATLDDFTRFDIDVPAFARSQT